MFRSRIADLFILSAGAASLSMFAACTRLQTAGNQATLTYGVSMLFLATVITVVRRNGLSSGLIWASMFFGGFAGVIMCGMFYPPLIHGYDRAQDPAGLPLFWTSVCMTLSSIIGAIGWVLYNLVTSEWDVRDVAQET